MKETWYKDGLKFECTGCGNCCKTHGGDEEYAYVYLAAADVHATSKLLKVDQDSFLEKYCLHDGQSPYLKSTTGHCLFLDDKDRCKIYPVRPGQCATWPFWWENLDKATWEGPVTACCPGVGRGKVYSKEEIEKIAQEREDRYL